MVLRPAVVHALRSRHAAQHVDLPLGSSDVARRKQLSSRRRQHAGMRRLGQGDQVVDQHRRMVGTGIEERRRSSLGGSILIDRSLPEQCECRKRFEDAPLHRAFFILACATAGCGDGKPWVDKSLSEATVSGIVSVKGKPAERRDDPLQRQQFRANRPDQNGRDRPRRVLYDQGIHRREPGVVRRRDRIQEPRCRTGEGSL